MTVDFVLALVALVATCATITLSVLSRRRLIRRYDGLLDGQEKLIDELCRAFTTPTMAHCPACGARITTMGTSAVCGNCGVRVIIFTSATVAMSPTGESTDDRP